MQIRSLSYRTDLALLEASGSVIEDRRTHLVVRTPDNPDFYWGNYLLLAKAPYPGGEREVIAAFHTEFPKASHVTIGIDEVDPDAGVLAAFEDAGMSVSRDTALVASELTDPPNLHAECVIRPFEDDDDWAAWLRWLPRDQQAYGRGTRRAEERLAAQGRGRRWGAYVDGTLVCSAAVYLSIGGQARYQDVETVESARRQGLAGTMIHTIGCHALRELGATSLVIVAEDDGPAMGVYRSLGFTDALHGEAPSVALEAYR